MTSDRATVATHRIGTLAAATGLTVRTLHYYEEIGLLTPSTRSDAGHRIYGTNDVQRLYRICLLKRLGLPLDDIRAALDEPAAADLRSAMTDHLAEVEQRLEAATRLRGRLGRLLTSLGDDTPSTTDFLNLMEDMTMLDSNLQRRISILVYRDLEAAHAHLVRVFGLEPGDLTRDGDGNVVHGELEAGDGVVWLHPEASDFALASPATLGAASATMAVLVDDVDAHHRHAAEQGAEIVYAPTDQPYGYREYGARDLEGHLWSFMKLLD